MRRPNQSGSRDNVVFSVGTCRMEGIEFGVTAYLGVLRRLIVGSVRCDNDANPILL